MNSRGRAARRLRIAAALAIALTISACGSSGAHRSPSTAASQAAGVVAVSWSATSGLVLAAPGAKAVLDVYEDPACEACSGLEASLISDVQGFAYEGKLSLRRHFTDGLDAREPAGNAYSLRAGNAILCAADQRTPTTVIPFVASVFELGDGAGLLPPGATHPPPTDSALITQASRDGVVADTSFRSCIAGRTHASAIGAATRAAADRGIAASSAGVYLDGTALNLRAATEADLVQRVAAAAGVT